jgi:hypothetical protein
MEHPTMTNLETAIANDYGYTPEQIIRVYDYLRHDVAGDRPTFTGGYNWRELDKITNGRAVGVFGCLVRLGWLSERIIPHTYGHAEFTFTR